MPLGNDFSTVDPTVEQVTLTFNFYPWFGPGVTVQSVLAITVSVAAESLAQDPNPQGIIVGGPQISNLPSNPLNTAVLQQVGNCDANVTYLIECLIMTTDNQKLQLGSHLPCVTLQ